LCKILKESFEGLAAVKAEIPPQRFQPTYFRRTKNTDKATCISLREGHRLRVCEKRVQGSEGLTGRWRKSRNEELHNLCTSPDITGVIKSRRMSWAGNVAGMDEMRNVKCVQNFNQKTRREEHLEKLGIYWSIISN
jgi:hypothetical protein